VGFGEEIQNNISSLKLKYCVTGPQRLIKSYIYSAEICYKIL